MKRAILVSAGTVAGLAAVLTYSSGDIPMAVAADVPGGGPGVAGLGGPAPDTTDPAAAASPDAAASASASAKPTTPAKPAAKPTTPAKPGTAKTNAPTTTKTTAPVVKPTVAPKPKVTPPATAVTYMGTAVTYKYGTLQMAIKVKAGKVIDAWAVKYPNGDSQPYSEMAMPILRSQTIGTHSSNIAGATGASLTSAAWKKSLAGALAKAGI